MDLIKYVLSKNLVIILNIPSISVREVNHLHSTGCMSLHIKKK